MNTGSGDSRRRLLPWRSRSGSTFGVAMAVAVALAACGGQDDTEGAADGPAEGDAVDAVDTVDAAEEAGALPAAEGVVEYPLHLETDAGEVVIEERPERIAVVDIRPISTDILFELGVAPVLAPITVDYGGWLDQGDIDQIETLWEVTDEGLVNLEQVAVAEPDLIVHFSNRELEPSRRDELNRIAPTIALLEGASSWQDMTDTLAEVLDLTGEGERVIDSVDAAVAEARESLAEHHGKTAAYLHIHAGEQLVYVSTPGRDAALFFESLGFTLPEAAEEIGADSVVPMENVELIDADFLLVTSFAQADADPVIESELYRSVPAVADGRVAYEIEGSSDVSDIAVGWALAATTPKSVKAAAPVLAEHANEVLG